MAADGLMSSYVGHGTHAARPATPNVIAGVSPVYYETDTTNTFIWTGSAWVQVNGGGGAATLAVATKTANYTITSSDDVILADATGGVFTVTVPTAVAWTKRITVLKIDSSTNAVTIGTTSGQTINGQGTRLLKAQFSGATLISDNANWRTSEESLPLTTKGDLMVGLAANDMQRLAVGSDGQVLTADSSQATGLKYAAAPGASANVLLAAVAGTDGATASPSSNYVAFSTAWITASLTTTATQDIIIEVQVTFTMNADDTAFFAIMRSGTQIFNTGSFYESGGTGYSRTMSFRWVDKALAAGTYTYEVRCGSQSSHTFTLKNGILTVPTTGSTGGSMMTVTSAANV